MFHGLENRMGFGGKIAFMVLTDISGKNSVGAQASATQASRSVRLTLVVTFIGPSMPPTVAVLPAFPEFYTYVPKKPL